MNRCIAFLLGLLTMTSAFGGGKAPQFIISFHEEGDQFEGERRVREFPVNGQNHYFRTIPVLTQENIKAYWPFVSEDGVTYGAVFWLDAAGRMALQRLGNAAQRSQYLAAAFNRQPVDVVKINGLVDDGKIVIWKGLDPTFFPSFDKKFKRVPGGNSGTPALAGAPTTKPDGTPILDLAAADAADKAAKKGKWQPGKPKSTGNPVQDASLGPDFHENISPSELPQIMEVKPTTPAKPSKPAPKIEPLPEPKVTR